MKKLLKYAAFGLIAVIVLIAGIAAYFASTFNPNDYKQDVIDLVKENNNRDLIIDGDITLTFWPKLGADLGKIAISDPEAKGEFASINSAKVALSTLPLLKNSLVVDTIYIDGAKANIIKYKDGTTNYDDFLSTEESESSDIVFNVQGINVRDSEIHYIDETKDATYSISQFNLTTGRVALGEPVDIDANFNVKANQPALDIAKQVKGEFLYDPENKHFKVSGLDSVVTGDMFGGKNIEVKSTGDIDAELENLTILVDDLKVVASGDFDGAQQTVDLSAPSININEDNVNSDNVTLAVTQKKDSDRLNLNMTLANISGSPKAIESSGISGDVNMTQGKRTIAGTFSSPFKGNIEALVFDLPKLIGQLNIKDPSLPNGAIQGSFNLSANTDINKELANSAFNLTIDGTKLNGDVAVASFKQPNIQFNLNADKLDVNKLMGAPSNSASSSEPADMSALNGLLLNGKVKVNQIIYDTYQVSGLNLGIKADGKKVAVSGLNVKVNDSQIKGSLGISQFARPLYSFNLNVDQLNLDDYITESASDQPTTGDEIIDLSALKALNANGSVKIGKLSYGKTKLSNVRIDLKADKGVATLAPFSANLYGGSMKGTLSVDARDTPNIAFKQTMRSVSVGPLLQDTINNDMLSGKGTVNVDISTQGNTVNKFKKSLAGTSSIALADGALKGIDIAGQIRGIKNKINTFQGNAVESESDATKKTDFSELTASFNIKDGVASNNDLAMKAPILRLAKGDSSGTIDIGNESINYSAVPTIVKSIKGQGGEDLNQLAGVSVPLKIAGNFANPTFGLDTKALVTGIAKTKLLEKVGGEKGAAVKDLIGGGDKVEALKGLLGKKKKAEEAPADAPANEAEEKPASVEDVAKEGLKDLLKF